MRSNTPEIPSALPTEGFSRRQVATAAAWSLPVVALAVAAPAAAATDPVTGPTATVIGTLGGTILGAQRTVSFTAGTVTFDPRTSGLSTGNITVLLSLFGGEPGTNTFPLIVDNSAWAAQGWTRLSDFGGQARFRHASISSGTILTGGASWAGDATAYVNVAVGLTLATPGIGALGLTYTANAPED